jgi:hypothetical protein
MKKLMAFTFALVFALILTAGANGDNSGALKSKKEVEAILTNFSISFYLDAQGQNPYYFHQANCNEGTVFKLKGDDNNSFGFIDFVNKQLYTLDEESKTGEAEPFEAPAERYRGFMRLTASHLFMHEDRIQYMVKTGNEKILGRNTTVYTITYSATAKMQFWIDDVYGFALKYEQTGSNRAKMEVTEFKVGGVTVAGMVNLREYKIE